MVRNYKRKVGARQYKNYTDDQLQSVVKQIAKGELKFREAVQQYKISIGTLVKYVRCYKQALKQAHQDETQDNVNDTGTNNESDSEPDEIPVQIDRKKSGHPTCLSKEDESIIADSLALLSEWGFPLDKLELRILTKSYLDARGVVVPLFKDNLPGRDWALSFLKRHKNVLTQRMCQNIKQKRAMTSRELLQEYFTKLKESLVGIPDGNILNYDETNFTNDPKSKKMIFKAKTKRPERIINYTKSAYSVMFAITDNGMCLPPYTVYKAEALWDTWTEGGPPGARYNRTKSGWFDSASFEDWFFTIILPWAKSREGPKLVIGDNLSSHFSTEVLKMCKQNNILFVCLPANTTHLTQPLDVAFYGPMKKLWRSILEQWRITAGRNKESLPKETFPKLLKKLMLELENNKVKNILSGFAATGIKPFSPERVLKKLPIGVLNEQSDGCNPTPENSSATMQNVVIEMLSKMRQGPQTKVTKKKKLPVKAGKSISFEEFKTMIKEPITTGTNSKPSTSGTSTTKTPKTTKPTKKIKLTLDSSSSDSDPDADFSDTESFMDVSIGHVSDDEPEEVVPKVSSWVIVQYALRKTKKHFVGQILELVPDGLKIKFTRQSSGGFIWPDKEDCDEVSPEDIIQVLPEPNTNNRGIMKFTGISFAGLNVQ